MYNIKTIIKRDIKALLTHFFPLVIAVGLCILPALYAWLNIYSNGDPYGNSGNVKIAAASEDAGWTDEDTGEFINVGDEIIEQIKDNDSVDWVILDSADEALDGVKSGEYYAAVVLSEEFSQNMTNGLMNGLQHPTITYYENEKKNAVATKITDTVVSTLKTSIDQMYVEIFVSSLFESADELGDEVMDENADGTETPKVVTTFSDRIDQVNDNIASYKLLLESLTAADERLNASLQDADADLDSLADKAGEASDTLSGKTVSGVLDTMQEVADTVDGDLADLQDAVDRMQNAASSDEKEDAYDTALSNLKKARRSLNSMISSLQSLKPHTKLVRNQINNTVSSLKSYVTDINTVIDLMEDIDGDISTGLDNIESTLDSKVNRLRDTYTDDIRPDVEDAVDEIDSLIADSARALSSVQEDIVLLRQIVDGTRQSVSDLNDVMSGGSQTLSDVSVQLEELKEKLNAISDKELFQRLAEFMDGDPEGYGKFLSEPVTIESEAVYPVNTYGDGVTPFYTTLALWVGCIFLLALMKASPSTEGLKNPREYELFLGRFGIFFLLGQLQWAIIYAGNICILHTQCMHPARLYLTGAVTSFTFMLLCYAVTLAFADVGKAIIVVIIVLQIAGSSGTYPIEVLPEFFQKVYVFFPFPYAINAMREAMFGYYADDYIIYMLQLLMFAVAGLALGLVVRLPFIGVKNFMQQRMKDTGLM